MIRKFQLRRIGSKLSFPASDNTRARKPETSPRWLVAALKECIQTRDLEGGKRLHSEAVAAGCNGDEYVAAALITMYRKCGSMEQAREVFEALVHCKDVVAWNSLILGYAENGQTCDALRLFWSMDCERDDATFVAALKACTSLSHGMAVHARAAESGLDSKLAVANGLVEMYCRCGDHRRALAFFESMKTEPSPVTFLVALKACSTLAAQDESSREYCLAKGVVIHAKARACGCHNSLLVSNALVDMYGKCSSMVCARDVFDSMFCKDVITWTSLILGYVKNGQSSSALELYTSMTCHPNHVTFIALLKACGKLAAEEQVRKNQFCLEKISHLHRLVRQNGYETHIFVANTLLDTYCKCSSMVDARHLFDKMHNRDAVTWNCLIMGYVENGEAERALDVFTTMTLQPDAVTFLAVLKACSGMASERRREFSVERGVSIHRKLRAGGFHSDLVVTTALLDMYTKCKAMLQARAVFDQMPRRSVVTWNSLLLGYVENGESAVALELFQEMDCQPNHVSFVAAVKACGALASEGRVERKFVLEKGISLHRRAKELGLHTNTFVSNTLIDMYSKCKTMTHAREVFDGMTSKDVVSWNCIILGYVENEQSSVALFLFNTMTVEPNSLTFTAVLKACVSLASGKNKPDREDCLGRGISIHAQVKERGLEPNIVVWNTLVDLYSKCGSMKHAHRVFCSIPERNTVSWNCLILGYVDNGDSQMAMELFKRMDCQPNGITFLAVLKAAGGLSVHEADVVDIHRQVNELGYDSDVAVATSLLDLYCKCRSMSKAQAVFESMAKPDVVAWTSLMMGYADNGESPKAIELFLRMDCQPDCPSFIAALKACGNVAGVELGRHVHARMCKMGLECGDEMVETSVVDFYAKCSRMDTAEHVFSSLQGCPGNTFSWTALIAGYTTSGKTEEVFKLAAEMERAGVEMDEITLVCVLSACSHAGMVDQGKRCFNCMQRKYGVIPNVEHCNCMADMLGRANRLGEAVRFVESMPCKPNAITWTSLLGACRKWKNVEVGRVAFQALVSANPNQGVAYVLMSELYDDYSGYVDNNALQN